MPARKGGFVIRFLTILACLLTVLINVAVAVVPRDDAVRESVDLIELNHYFDENGRHVFDQTIFYLWNEKDARYDAMGYRLVKHESQLPRPDCCGRKFWTVLWQDGDRHRAITAHAYRETWTQYDVELYEREILPKEQRRKLKGEK
jgi:hypothetical protein